MKRILRKIKRNIDKITRKYYIFKYYFIRPKYGLNTKENRDKKVIISLTSYPARLSKIHICINSLLHQKYKPDKILLYLGNDSEEADISKQLKKLEKYGLEIRRGYENIRPHKKYFYALQEYPNDIIITVDDDVIYDSRFTESLMCSYSKFPGAVSARRVHRMVKTNNELLPYVDWEFECNSLLVPSMELMAIGVGGILYPPYCMNSEVLNLDNIKRICLDADDIWLKFMQVMNGTPVVWVKSKFPHPVEISRTQETALYKSNLNNNRNDLYINQMEGEYNINLRDYAYSISVKSVLK